MGRKEQLLSVAAALLATSCATRPSPSAQLMPTEAQVEAYVSQNWNHFYWIFNNFAGRKGQAELISVRAHDCGRSFGLPACSFDVTARYPETEPIIRTLWSQFEWDAQGRLQDTLFILEDPKRPGDRG